METATDDTGSADRTNILRVGMLAGGILLVGGMISFRPPSGELREETDATVSATFQTTKQVTVHVAGAVVNPGLLVLEVPFGTDPRIADLLRAAGGLTPQADTVYIDTQLNLAAPIKDGSKLYIPAVGEYGTTQSPQTGAGGEQVPGTTVAINTASKAELQTLKGIGEARAEAIIAKRPFPSYEAFVAAKVVPSSVAEALRDQIRF